MGFNCLKSYLNFDVNLQSCKNDLNSLWIHENKDEIEYFRLSDLWDCFDEPSAYGLGSKVDLNNGESVMQYYVPYLSAIQIYTNKSTAISRFDLLHIKSVVLYMCQCQGT